MGDVLSVATTCISPKGAFSENYYENVSTRSVIGDTMSKDQIKQAELQMEGSKYLTILDTALNKLNDKITDYEVLSKNAHENAKNHLKNDPIHGKQKAGRFLRLKRQHESQITFFTGMVQSLDSIKMTIDRCRTTADFSTLLSGVTKHLSKEMTSGGLNIEEIDKKTEEMSDMGDVLKEVNQILSDLNNNSMDMTENDNEGHLMDDELERELEALQIEIKYEKSGGDGGELPFYDTYNSGGGGSGGGGEYNQYGGIEEEYTVSSSYDVYSSPSPLTSQPQSTFTYGGVTYTPPIVTPESYPPLPAHDPIDDEHNIDPSGDVVKTEEHVINTTKKIEIDPVESVDKDDEDSLVTL